jgi:hypothetical protein
MHAKKPILVAQRDKSNFFSYVPFASKNNFVFFIQKYNKVKRMTLPHEEVS